MIEIKEIYCFYEISNFRGMIKFMFNVVISNFFICNCKNIFCVWYESFIIKGNFFIEIDKIWINICDKIMRIVCCYYYSIGIGEWFY